MLACGLEALWPLTCNTLRQDQPKGGCYAKDYGSNMVREYAVLLDPPPPAEEDPTLGVQEAATEAE